VKKMTARQLKNETGKALQWAARGEKILITRRGKPVAWLVQAASEVEEEADPDASWQDILDTLQGQEPAFEDWQSAIAWSRGRT
jgi:prevent-host-death family protein